MLLNILFIVVGIALVLWGADRLTDGAVAVAEKMKMPQIVIWIDNCRNGYKYARVLCKFYFCLEGNIRLGGW